jgi:hypothetical protein
MTDSHLSTIPSHRFPVATRVANSLIWLNRLLITLTDSRNLGRGGGVAEKVNVLAYFHLS